MDVDRRLEAEHDVHSESSSDDEDDKKKKQKDKKKKDKKERRAARRANLPLPLPMLPQKKTLPPHQKLPRPKQQQQP